MTLADAHALAMGQPGAKLLFIPDMNHVLKDVQSDDRAANLATYANPDLPIDPKIVDAIADFVKR